MLSIFWTLGQSSQKGGPIKQGLSVRPSFFLSFHLSSHPSICLGIFLESHDLFFLNFVVVLETHMKLCVAEPDFQEKIFLPPKLGKWAKNGSKTGFFDLLKTLVISFYLICSIMKIYIIHCVPAQIPYGKFLFWRLWSKCSQRIRLQDFLINHISRTNQLSVYDYS